MVNLLIITENIVSCLQKTCIFQNRNSQSKLLQKKIIYYEGSQKTLERIVASGLTNRKKHNPSSNFTPDWINDFFISASNVNPGTKFINPNLDHIPSTNSQFKFRHITFLELQKAFNHFQSNATGPDGISLKVLKIAWPAIQSKVRDIFNESLDRGIFPSMWKDFYILPFKKVTNPTATSDHRPIAFLCMISKIFEKCVSFQLIEYIESKNILNNSQSGFRQGQGAQTILTKLIDDIRLTTSKKLYTFLVLFDFTKAFDRVKHALLIMKLKKYGFSDEALKWFESYLSSRRQSVLGANNERSGWRTVENGVPQGSVLGHCCLSSILMIYVTKFLQLKN